MNRTSPEWQEGYAAGQFPKYPPTNPYDRDIEPDKWSDFEDGVSAAKVKRYAP